MKLKYLIAFYTIDLLDVVDIIQMSEKLLEEGLFSDALCRLAAENPSDNNRIEIRIKMDAVLSGLNIKPLSLVKAGKVCICYWCEKILADEISPKQGVKFMTGIFLHAERIGLGNRYGNEFKAEQFYGFDDFYDVIDFYEKSGSCDAKEPIYVFDGKECNIQESVDYINNQVKKEAVKYLEQNLTIVI